MADRGDAAHRLDHAVARHLAGPLSLSRAELQRLVGHGRVTVNGAAASRPAQRLQAGDVVWVDAPRPPRRPAPSPEALPLTILYEDAALVVVMKPAGMVVHPSAAHRSGTLVNALLWHAGRDPGADAAWQPRLVQRLDRHTSGLIVIAKSADVHTALQGPGARFVKDYLAVVWGRPVPATGEIAHRLGRDPLDRRRVTVSDGGATALTRYQVLDRSRGPARGLSLVRCVLVTGRTHQLRVHLAAQGWPIVGDPEYRAGAAPPPCRCRRQSRRAGVPAPGVARLAARVRASPFRPAAALRSAAAPRPGGADGRRGPGPGTAPGPRHSGHARIIAGGRSTQRRNMTRDDLSARLAALPHTRLATLPTPLEEASRLRTALGGAERCPRILIKRDDLTGLGLGGNKARKLDYLLGEALAQGATAVVTTGAVQSNHARMTAAAAAMCGLEAHLVLTATTAIPAEEGNLLLDRLFGAHVSFVPSVDPMLAVGHDEAAVAEVAAAIAARGGRPYVIPVGGSSAVGALGYVAGTLELVGQLDALGIRPSRLYFGSGSRGTQAGLTLGAQLTGASYRLHGIAVSAGEAEKIERARRVANEAAALLGAGTAAASAEFFTDQTQIGDGYGLPTAAALAALVLVARSEALVLDPTYTAKAMAGLVADVRAGRIDPGDTVVFLHTGGSPAVFTTAAREHLAPVVVPRGH